MLEDTAPGLPIARRELRETLRQLQSDTILNVLPALYVGAALLLALADRLEEPTLASVPALILIFLPPLVYVLQLRTYAAGAWALVLGTLATTATLIWWGRFGPFVYLLPLPVGLAALFTSAGGGAFVAALCTFALVGPIAPFSLDAVERGVAIVGIWAALGMVWVTMRCFLTPLGWYSTTYQRYRKLLDEARDTQMQLRQTLADLAEANSQLTRLHRLAQGLRQTAEDARRTKERFVANVSHELRTPLNMIIGFGEMITRSPDVYGGNLSPKLLADLDVILRNSRHLSRLIDDVLDLSQIAAGQMAITREYVSLRSIIEAAVTAVRPLFESKSLYLRMDLADDLPPVFCDATRIRQVLLNLLSNAGRFTARGGVEVEALREGDAVTVSVADTGPGISADTRERVFEPFYQLDAPSRERSGGSGLGLSISKSFVELHGGRIWFETEEGGGTTFSFRLPISAPGQPDGGALRWFSPHLQYEERARPPRAQMAPAGPRFVVLEAGAAMERLLARYGGGAEIVKVGSLPEAIEEVSRVPAQALLVNQAPGGATAASTGDGAQLPYGTPLIACSIPDLRDAAGDLGVSDYLVKPISPEALLAALDRLRPPPKLLLIADDEADVLRLFRRMLASSGRDYQVLTALDGEETMRQLREQRPDVLLLDLIMPRMDGFRVLEEKNAEPSLRQIPVIVISARDPAGQPIVSNGLTVTQRDGLSASQLLACIRMLTRALSPDARAESRARPGALPG